VEEIPGTITYGESLDNCRANLREALKLMVDIHRDEARMGLDNSCILEPMEIEVGEDAELLAAAAASPGQPRYA
jgi:hypothetical protein